MSWRLLFRLTAPFAAISALVFLLAGVAAWYVNRLETDLADVLAINVAGVRAAVDLEIGLGEIRGHIDDYLRTGDRGRLGPVGPLRQETAGWLREAERLATTPAEQVVIAQVRRGYDRFFAEFDRLALRDPADGPPGDELRNVTDHVLTAEILPPARAYRELNELFAAQTAEENRALANHGRLALLGLGVCGVAACLLGCYGVARAMTRGLAQLGVPIRDAAGLLNTVAGPGPVAAGRDFDELESSLHRVADLAGTVVARLRLSEREALRAEQLAAVGQMAAGLAHELRNPLMAMKILVQPAAEPGSAVALTPEDLAVLDEEITRLDRSIQAFLDFARPPLPEMRTFDAGAVVDQAVHLVSRRAEQCGVRVERAAPDGPVPVEADVAQVRQVLLNLLLNALDATGEGGAVRIDLVPAGGPDGCVTIRVADTGRGLPADLGPRIFEPFVSTKDTGMGLGLSICKRIVEAHGGRIDAAGRPGGGAVFAVRLPAHARTAPEDRRHADPAHRR